MKDNGSEMDKNSPEPPAAQSSFVSSFWHKLSRIVDEHVRANVPANCGYRLFEKAERCVHVVFPSTKEKLIVSNAGSGGHYRFTLYGLQSNGKCNDSANAATFDATKNVFLHDDNIDYSVIGFINDPSVSLEQGLDLCMSSLRARNIDIN